MKKKNLLFVMCCILMFAQVSFAEVKIGIVDIQSIVNRSESVQTLKREHTAQIQSLNSIITEAQNEIAKECNPQKIVELQDKYNAEFNRRKEIIDNQYQARLTEIENCIRRDIAESAKKYCYDFVAAKSVVFYGGEDITELVAKDIH